MINIITILKTKKAFKKTLIIMKLTFILISFCTMQSFAGINAQTITLKVDNKEIAKILTFIEKQADYRFLFNSRLKDLKLKVSVNFSDMEITDALKTLFSGTTLTYLILENNLVAIRSLGSEVQDISIQGKVTNESGEAVSASIVVKGTNNGTNTDLYDLFLL